MLYILHIKKIVACDATSCLVLVLLFVKYALVDLSSCSWNDTFVSSN